MMRKTVPARMSERRRRELAAQGITHPRSTIKSVSPGFSRERRKKGIKPENPVRKAKRKASYAKKLQAYRRSETYKEVEARAEGRCEFTVWYVQDGVKQSFRCHTEVNLHHHHKTYQRLGGKELPSDMQVLCRLHHAQVEAAKPHKNGRPF